MTSSARALSVKPDVIIDDGGDMVHILHEEHPEWAVNLRGGCEETTTGIIRLRNRAKAGQLRFPMFNINDADCKHLFDNRYGTGQSVWGRRDGAPPIWWWAAPPSWWPGTAGAAKAWPCGPRGWARRSL